MLAENAPTEKPPAAPAEGYATVEESATVEPPAAENQEEAIAEAPTEYPAEDYPIAEPTPEAEAPPADEAALAEYPPIEEATAESEPEAAQEPNVPSKSRAEDSGDGEVVIICTSCTTMLLVEYDGPYPYRITSSMGSDRESYSWLLHTTYFSCVNKHKREWGSRDRFSNACMAAFAAAILSEEFMKRTSWFEVAGRVCRKPIRIVMDEARRSVAYGEIDILRVETTAKCRMRGLRSVGSTGERSGRTEIIDSFVPGGFM